MCATNGGAGEDGGMFQLVIKAGRWFGASLRKLRFFCPGGMHGGAGFDFRDSRWEIVRTVEAVPSERPSPAVDQVSGGNGLSGTPEFVIRQGGSRQGDLHGAGGGMSLLK